MKLNKLRIRLLQFFGFGKDICHQDDISIGIVLDDLHYTMTYANRAPEALVIETKKQIKQKFSEDAKFEANCRKVKQVWAIFYLDTDKVRRGGLIRKIYYDVELFYPGYDQKAYDRHMKLKELGL